MTITPEVRKERLQDLRRRGIAVPVLSEKELAASVAPASIRRNAWLAHLWPRPTASTPGVSEFLLSDMQREWDESATFVKGQAALMAEVEARKAAEPKATADADVARRGAEADQIKAELREKSLRLPGTSESEFVAMYPSLLADHPPQQRERQDSIDEQVRRTMRDITMRAAD